MLSGWVMVACFEHNDITDSSIDLLIMAVISYRCLSIYFFKSQVSNGSKSHDLFGDLVIIFLTAASEAGRNTSITFRLSVITTSIEILHVLFGESEMI